jgi:GntR family transcriptional repressor for pyruvate dehydrogenase complex
MALFSEVPKATVSERIIEQVKELVLQGKLRPGQRLPSERELAEQLSVGRSSVREATRAMVALGVVEMRPGEGAFIRPDFPRSTMESVEWSSLMLNGHSQDLVEARMAVERTTAKLAAGRAAPEERARLRGLAEQMAGCSDLEPFIDLDIAFHFTLAEASQNIVLRGILGGIQQLMRSSMLRVLQDEELRRVSVQQHLLLCDAIDRSDAEQAEQVMVMHLKKDKLALQSGT